ncbi:hypothetical protein PoB_002788200 [Plakobranchus ocellatus]|uniref:Uncharacterized protein n=1 Tax=Plakobranchus ocellatus TaxID=259542 RepID=A0AAV4A3E5_9GAST|nr:hypothetical protein PoB_002788200 [Plakobranchus ocellatus]
MGRPKGYAFFQSRDLCIPHYGSGYIDSVKEGSGSCPCCHQTLQCPSWWAVDVITACHVIFDTREAQCTHVDFFYDDITSTSCGRMKTLKGVRVLTRNFGADHCKLRCVTHEENLAHELQQIVSKYNFKVWTMKAPPMRAVGMPCFIVSHPHGQPKKVTIGKVEAIEKLNNSNYKLIYSTNTCSGSSGALVLVLQEDAGPGTSWLTWALWTSVHSAGGELNESSSEIQLLT